MELLRLKKRLSFAYRGHKLLRDKQEEMMHQFLKLINKTKLLRDEIEEKIAGVHKHFISLSMTDSKETIDFVLSILPPPKFTVETRQLMNLSLPKFTFDTSDSVPVIPYVSSEINYTMRLFNRLMKLLVELSEKEKTIELIAYELERTRRRVNSLEYVLIPSLKETIKYITDKLNELERGNIARLMKFKEIKIRDTSHFSESSITPDKN